MRIKLAFTLIISIFSFSCLAEVASNIKQDERLFASDYFIGGKFSYVNPNIKTRSATESDNRTNKTKNTMGFALEVGRAINKDFKISLSLANLPSFSNQFSDNFLDENNNPATVYLITSQSSQKLSINGEYNIWQLSKDLNLFAEAGVGVSYNHLDNHLQIRNSITADGLLGMNSSNDRVSFSYSVGTGFEYKIDKRLSISLSYLFNDYGLFKAAHSVYEMGNYNQQDLELGKLVNDSDRYSFRLRSHMLLLGFKLYL